MTNGQPKPGRGQWGSRLGFILAAAGSAIGLGNLWKFPYITYKFGAGAFVLVYLACIFLVGLPIMVAEIMVGRRTHRNPVGAFKALRPNTAWKLVGGLGVLCGFVLLSYYSVVAGWAVEYTIKSARRDFAKHEKVSDASLKDHLWKTRHVTQPESRRDVIKAGFGKDLGSAVSPRELKPNARKKFDVALATAWKEFENTKPKAFSALKERTLAALWAQYQNSRDFEKNRVKDKRNLWVSKLFGDFVSSPGKVILYHLLFMLLTITVVLLGVSNGIERVSKVLMPLLFIMLIFLVIKALSFDGAGGTIAKIFRPNFHALSGEAVLEALGHAFFTLSLGMGAMLTYGSYLGKDDSIATASLTVTILDTVIALLATVVIFAAITAFNMPVTNGGIANLFIAIPAVFQESPGGNVMSIVFYVLVAFAALTSTISLLEVVVSYFIDERGWSRKGATCVMGGLIALLGIPSALSLNSWSAIKIPLLNMGFLDAFDYLVSNWFLPLGGLLIALFVGWGMTDAEKRDELADVNPLVYKAWHLLIRYVAPTAVASVFVWLIYAKLTK